MLTRANCALCGWTVLVAGAATNTGAGTLRAGGTCAVGGGRAGLARWTNSRAWLFLVANEAGSTRVLGLDAFVGLVLEVLAGGLLRVYGQADDGCEHERCEKRNPHPSLKTNSSIRAPFLILHPTTWFAAGRNASPHSRFICVDASDVSRCSQQTITCQVF